MRDYTYKISHSHIYRPICKTNWCDTDYIHVVHVYLYLDQQIDCTPSPQAVESATRGTQTHWQRHTGGGSPRTPVAPGTPSVPSRRRHWSAWFLTCDKYHSQLSHKSSISRPLVSRCLICSGDLFMWRKCLYIYNGFQIFVCRTYNYIVLLTAV